MDVAPPKASQFWAKKKKFPKMGAKIYFKPQYANTRILLKKKKCDFNILYSLKCEFVNYSNFLFRKMVNFLSLLIWRSRY